MLSIKNQVCSLSGCQVSLFNSINEVSQSVSWNICNTKLYVSVLDHSKDTFGLDYTSPILPRCYKTTVTLVFSVVQKRITNLSLIYSILPHCMIHNIMAMKISSSKVVPFHRKYLIACVTKEKQSNAWWNVQGPKVYPIHLHIAPVLLYCAKSMWIHDPTRTTLAVRVYLVIYKHLCNNNLSHIFSGCKDIYTRLHRDHSCLYIYNFAQSWLALYPCKIKVPDASTQSQETSLLLIPIITANISQQPWECCDQPDSTMQKGAVPAKWSDTKWSKQLT